MRIIDAINEVDTLKPNDFPASIKVLWLYRLDLRLKQDIIDTHEYNEGEEEITITEYSPDNTEQELLVPEPYSEIYTHWLCAQIDYYNLEYDGFNACNAMFESVRQSYRNSYNQSHMPKGKDKFYF